jgi:hypothetical protein
MRLWSIHPRYLDRQGLTAVWREALLAQKVLSTATRGYQRHPQLERFRASGRPGVAIGSYLRGVLEEAAVRGFAFDAAKIKAAPEPLVMEVTTRQLEFEWLHLLEKLRRRNPSLAREHARLESPRPHPLFRVVDGPIADWERP